VKRTYEYLVLHASMHEEPSDKVTLRDIDRQHRAAGALGIGFHYVIRRDGKVEIGRQPERPGNFTRGFNTKALGVCLVGIPPWTQAQRDSLGLLIQNVTDIFGPLQIVSHREIVATSKQPVINLETP
jgi:N-acetylmuramoyl-L-alanine amidase